MPPKKDARNKLLDAAMAVFRAKGYAATSVDELCQAAGVTKGAFFHHFRSKEDARRRRCRPFRRDGRRAFRRGALPRARRAVGARPRLHRLPHARSSPGEIPEYTCLLGTMVQEAYATHPAIRAACEREIVGHADDARGRHRRGPRRRRPARRRRRASLALHIQARAAGRLHPRQGHRRCAGRRRQPRPSPPLPRIALRTPDRKGRHSHELRRRIRPRGAHRQPRGLSQARRRRRSPYSRSTVRSAASNAGATTCPRARSPPSRWR